MCGIIGYIGKNKAINVLINGLEKMEYRGYDSSGVCLYSKDKIDIIKSIGKISNLKEKINYDETSSYTRGIAHTRWATHGGVTLENAHPHKQGKVIVVHNGIIENAKELKEQLKTKGYKFYSDTDTEVIAALLDYYLEDDILKTIEKAKQKLIGSYALGIVIEGIEDEMYIVKKDSPLIIGIGKGEVFFASDIVAINSCTNNFIFLSEGEVGILKEDKVEVYKDFIKQEKEVKTINVSNDSHDKNGFAHYMLKEINEEPVLLENMLQPFLEDINLLPDISSYDAIHIVGCGSALYAGMVFKYLLEEIAGCNVLIEVASEYRYRRINYDKKTLVVLISQSGETADTIAAMRFAKKSNADTLAIVNVENSTIAKESDKVLFIKAGVEVAVATTKAYILQTALLSLIALKLCYDKGIIKDIEKYLAEYKTIPKLIKETIDKEENYKKIAKEIYNSKDAFFIGRKIDYAYSLEGSLKLKEVSYINASAYQAGELKHGTISLIDNNSVVFGILTDEEIISKTLSNIIETEARGANVIVITNDKKIDYKNKILVPKVSYFTQGLLVIPTMQLIAYYTALLKNCSIDQPKNLAKSVTVE